MREAVPSIHFIDDFKVATVEIRRVEFFEFNDQVVFRSKMDVRVVDRVPINLKAVAGDIYNQLKEFGDPTYGNKVRRKLNFKKILVLFIKFDLSLKNFSL